MPRKRISSKKYALVTGAGTGLGFATAKLLAGKGWNVYATIIPSQTPDELQKISNVTPLVMDITDPNMVSEGYKRISNEIGEEGLAALVNVAALAAVGGGIIEGVSMENAKTLFEVNVFGTLRMIQTFLPLLRKYGPARIVNVASSGVRIPAPFSAIYAISKFAVEGITNALRLELVPFGIQATSIEPSAMRTPMTANHEENMVKTWEQMPPHIKELYYDKLKPALDYMTETMVNADPPEVVAEVIYKALTTKKMKIRYVGGNQAKYLPMAQRLLGENRFEKMVIKSLKLLPK